MNDLESKTFIETNLFQDFTRTDTFSILFNHSLQEEEIFIKFLHTLQPSLIK
jgi:hypothetical protein